MGMKNLEKMETTEKRKICKFLLTGELVEYQEEKELVRSIPLTATQRVRWMYDDIAPHDREVGVTAYAFVEVIRVKVSKEELEYASQHFSTYHDLTNLDLLRLFLHHLPNFPDIFENPHPLVVRHFMSLPPETYDSFDRNKLVVALSANPSEEMFEYVLTHRPDLFDWRKVVIHNPNPRILDRAVEHYRTSPEQARTLVQEFLLYTSSPDAVEFALTLAGGLDAMMQCNNTLCSHFLRNNSEYANAKKVEWLREKMGKNEEKIKKQVMNLLVAYCDEEEILGMVLEKMDTSSLLETGGIWYNQHDVVSECVLEYMKTHSPDEVSYSQKCRISWNTNPRIIHFLLHHEKGKKWMFFPEFLANSNDDATAYSLEWIAEHYEELATDGRVEGDPRLCLKSVSESASINNNTKMLMTLYTQYPLLIEREDCEWLYTVARNHEIEMDLAV